jgi:hypothetical protein
MLADRSSPWISPPLQNARGAESIALPASAAPITRVTLNIPRVGVELSTTAFVSEQFETDGQTRWTLDAQSQQPLTMSWKRRVEERRAEQPLRIRARVSELAGLGEDGGQITAAVRVEVLQGLAREVVVAIPPGLAVNTVDGATVAD